MIWDLFNINSAEMLYSTVKLTSVVLREKYLLKVHTDGIGGVFLSTRGSQTGPAGTGAGGAAAAAAMAVGSGVRGSAGAAAAHAHHAKAHAAHRTCILHLANHKPWKYIYIIVSHSGKSLKDAPQPNFLKAHVK